MIFEISFSISNFFLLLLFIFTFSKQSFLSIFDFWLKTPPNYKSCSKIGQNHQFALLSFTFHFKKINFLTLTFFLRPLTCNRPTVRCRTRSSPIWLFSKRVFNKTNYSGHSSWNIKCNKNSEYIHIIVIFGIYR